MWRSGEYKAIRAEIEIGHTDAEQYHRLGALGFFDGTRVELIRGEIGPADYVSPVAVPGASLLVGDLLP